jgi:hypothetical protein
VGAGLGVDEVVHCNDLKLTGMPVADGLEDLPPDAPEAVDPYFGSHGYDLPCRIFRLSVGAGPS